MSVRMMSAVWDLDGLTVGEKMVLLKLADCANDEGRNAYPALATVARACSLDERSVRRILAKLREAGTIEIEQEHDRATHRPTTYVVKLPGVNLSPRPQGHDVPRPGDIHDNLRGTPMPPDPSGDPSDNRQVIDRLREIHHGLSGLNLPSIRDQDQIGAWVVNGVTLAHIEEAYTSTMEWGPDDAWAAFRKALGLLVAKPKPVPAAETGLTDAQKAELEEDERNLAELNAREQAARTEAAARSREIRDRVLAEGRAARDK